LGFPHVIAFDCKASGGFDWQTEGDEAVLVKAEEVEHGYWSEGLRPERYGVAAVVVFRVSPNKVETLRAVESADHRSSFERLRANSFEFRSRRPN
jgi:hypothetical protein